jgi:hypothetical protein
VAGFGMAGAPKYHLDESAATSILADLMRGDSESFHWMTGLGWLMVLSALMVCVVVLLLPVFEGQRITAFWFVILPLVVVGSLMILFRRYRDNQP